MSDPRGAGDKRASASPAVPSRPGAEPESGQEVAAAPLLERLAERLGGRASVRTVFGEPVVARGVTVVPVARVTFGLGGGGGRGRAAARAGEGLGAGGGTHARPAGFIEIRGGTATYTAIRPPRPEALYGLAVLVAVVTVPRLLVVLVRRR